MYNKDVNQGSGREILFRLTVRRQFLWVFLVVLAFGNLVLLVFFWYSNRQLAEENSLKERQIAGISRQTDLLLYDKTMAESLLKDSQKTVKEKSDELAKVIADLDSARKDLEEKQALIKEKEEKIARQQSQISANSKELQELRRRPPLFSFQNRSSNPDIESQKADVKNLVENAYSFIEDLYGSPYLLHQITISFVDSLSREGSAAETYIKNSAEGLEIDIRIKSFDKSNYSHINMIIHEVVHGFHGIAIVMPVAYEEGMAVAVSDLVMDRLQQSGKITTPSRFLEHRAFPGITIPLDSSQFYSGDKVWERYQVVGESWWQLEKAHPGALKRFNEEWYKHIRDGEEPNQELVKQTLDKVCSGCTVTPW